MLGSCASSRGNTPELQLDCLPSEVTQTLQHLVHDAMSAQVSHRAFNGSGRLRDMGLSSLRLIALIIALESEFELGEAELAQLNIETTLETLLALCVAARQRARIREFPHRSENEQRLPISYGK